MRSSPPTASFYTLNRFVRTDASPLAPVDRNGTDWRPFSFTCGNGTEAWPDCEPNVHGSTAWLPKSKTNGTLSHVRSCEAL